jgi:hypothetical protein
MEMAGALTSILHMLQALLSFLLTATMSLTACLIGYLGDLHRGLTHSKGDTVLGGPFRPIFDNILPNIGEGKQRCRCYGLEQFFLSVADAQMATSFAIIIAAAVKWESISVISLSLVGSNDYGDIFIDCASGNHTLLSEVRYR